jgi:hypothetical protein
MTGFGLGGFEVMVFPNIYDQKARQMPSLKPKSGLNGPTRPDLPIQRGHK